MIGIYNFIKSKDLIIQDVTKQIHYEKGILSKTFFGGCVTSFGACIISYFALLKMVVMINNKEASMNSITYRSDLNDTSKLNLLDSSVPKPLLILTESSGASADDGIFKEFPIDSESKRYINIKIINV